MDVVFVGGGPAGLAGAIELARLVKKDKEAGGGLGDVENGVLEKAETLGVKMFTGFPADALLVEGDKVVGVRGPRPPTFRPR